MAWFLYDNGLRHERVKRHKIYYWYSMTKTLLFIKKYPLLSQKKPTKSFSGMVCDFIGCNYIS